MCLRGSYTWRPPAEVESIIWKSWLIMRLSVVVRLLIALLIGICSVSNASAFEDISSKVAFNHTDVKSTAGIIAAEYPGGCNIDQISEIYRAVRGGWRYVSDPRGPDYFSSADLTIRNGKEANSIGMGDCDDFAILMAALIESIGGTTRIKFVVYGLTGHAYAEVYLGQAEDPQVDEMIEWLKDEYNTDKIYKDFDLSSDEVWLNLDWWADHPGDDIYGGAAPEHQLIYIRSKYKEPPRMPPIIDSMDSTLGWNTYNGDDSNNSSIYIKQNLGGKKENAIEIKYNLTEGGYVGMSKEIDAEALDALKLTDGIAFSSWGKGDPNTIELKLTCKDDTTFGYSWSGSTISSDWTTRKALYKEFQCLGPQNRCIGHRLSQKAASNRAQLAGFLN